MKRIVLFVLIFLVAALCGCTPEKAPEPQQKIAVIVLAPADKEKLIAFQKELLSIESLADKAVTFAGKELKNVITGGEISVSITSIIEKTKAECLLAGASLAKKTVPEALPPEAKKLLNEGKSGLVDAYKGYAEAYDAINSFITDKNPMELLEYRKKYSQAQELFTSATDKIKTIMSAAGVPQ